MTYIIWTIIGVISGNTLIGYFVKNLSWIDSILFGLLAGFIAAILAGCWYWSQRK